MRASISNKTRSNFQRRPKPKTSVEPRYQHQQIDQQQSLRRQLLNGCCALYKQIYDGLYLRGRFIREDAAKALQREGVPVDLADPVQGGQVEGEFECVRSKGLRGVHIPKDQRYCAYGNRNHGAQPDE